jgi:hypothetical protein
MPDENDLSAAGRRGVLHCSDYRCDPLLQRKAGNGRRLGGEGGRIERSCRERFWRDRVGSSAGQVERQHEMATRLE